MKKELDTVLEVLHKLQKINPEFPLQYAICLCEIAKNEGLSLTDLSEQTGLALSTVSKITTALSKKKKRGVPYDLLEIRIKPTEKRRKQLFLSKNGRKLIKDIEHIIHG